jgi:chromate transporter
MLPGFILMIALAWLYSRLRIDGTVLGAVFLGVQASVLAIILRAVHRIGEHILVDRWLWAVAAGSAVASLLGVSFWVVLPTAGATYALVAAKHYLLALACLAVGVTLGALTVGGTEVAAPVVRGSAAAASTTALFLAGLKGGLLTFGGAYTAIPFVRHDTVGRGWITDAQFLDGLALSGVLPAPLVIFSTFVGWVCGGPAGAFAITAGMFLPAFAFSMIFYERLEAVAEHEKLQMFLAGVASAVVGLIAVTLVDLGRAAFERTPNVLASTIIFAVTLAIAYLWRSKLSTPVMLVVGGAIGMIALG